MTTINFFIILMNIYPFFKTSRGIIGLEILSRMIIHRLIAIYVENSCENRNANLNEKIKNK